jgi:hypothetical protein
VVEGWSECFEFVLNVEDDRRAKLMSICRRGVTSRNVGDHSVIEWQEVEEAVNKIKNVKASGEDEIPNKMLKRGGPTVVE